MDEPRRQGGKGPERANGARRGHQRGRYQGQRHENARRSTYSKGHPVNRGARSSEKYYGDPMAGSKIIQTPAPVSYNGSGTAIIWFRNDLRVNDNEALELANTAEHMIPLYIFDDRYYGTLSPNGFPRTGPFRAQFILESVLALREAFRLRSSDLVVRTGRPDEIIASVIRRITDAGHGPVHVIAHKEVTSEEIDMEERIVKLANGLARDSMNKTAVHVDFVWGSTLLHLDDLPLNPAGPALPGTFTEFRNLVESPGNWSVRAEKICPRLLRGLPPKVELHSESSAGLRQFLQVTGLDSSIDHLAEPDCRSVGNFKGGEAEAEDRVEDWIWKKDKLRTYFDTRNESGNLDFSSKFSPWLALGCISPRSIYWNCKRYEEKVEKNKSTYWMVFELLTRDYFRWVAAKAGKQLFAWNGFTGRGLHDPDIWTLPPGTITSRDKEHFDAWTAGRTGAPFVDASMRELAATGFMSNRGRQNVASFLIHDLKYPDWRAGAAYFESVLTDYEVCANWGNWAYLAGVGTDPRGGRRFNVVKQSMTYDPKGHFIKLWCNELSAYPMAFIHEPHRVRDGELRSQNIVVSGAKYPRPIVPLMAVRDQDRPK